MSDMGINKQVIARSFGLAAEHYDSVAHFQRWVGNELLKLIPASKNIRLLDLGTGTGYFLKPLSQNFSAESLVALDLSEGMIRHVVDHVCVDHNVVNSAAPQNSALSCVVGDADNLPFADGSFDLIFSSLAIQWCSDLEELFSEVSRVLAPKGIFACSTLLDGSLHELKAAWQSVDSTQHVNDFYALSDYRRAAQAAKFNLECFEQRQHVLQYKQVKELTRELKMLGAHNMTPERAKGLTGKSKMKRFLETYERFRASSGFVTATYEVGFAVLLKSRSKGIKE